MNPGAHASSLPHAVVEEHQRWHARQAALRQHGGPVAGRARAGFVVQAPLLAACVARERAEARAAAAQHRAQRQSALARTCHPQRVDQQEVLNLDHSPVRSCGRTLCSACSASARSPAPADPPGRISKECWSALLQASAL